MEKDFFVRYVALLIFDAATRWWIQNICTAHARKIIFSVLHKPMELNVHVYFPTSREDSAQLATRRNKILEFLMRSSVRMSHGVEVFPKSFQARIFPSHRVQCFTHFVVSDTAENSHKRERNFHVEWRETREEKSDTEDSRIERVWRGAVSTLKKGTDWRTQLNQRPSVSFNQYRSAQIHPVSKSDDSFA